MRLEVEESMVVVLVVVVVWDWFLGRGILTVTLLVLKKILRLSCLLAFLLMSVERREVDV